MDPQNHMSYQYRDPKNHQQIQSISWDDSQWETFPVMNARPAPVAPGPFSPLNQQPLSMMSIVSHPYVHFRPVTGCCSEMRTETDAVSVLIFHMIDYTLRS